MEAKSYFFSIIIPCHNSSKFIVKCLKSITTQNFTDFEIIIVDDFSQDGTINIVKAFVNNNKNIPIKIVVNNENRGPLYSRLEGLKYAKGLYVYFFDSDDFIGESLFEKTFNIIISHNMNVNIVVYGIETTFEDGTKDCSYIFNGNEISNKQLLFEDLMFGSLCSKCFSIKLFEKLPKYPESFFKYRFGDDFIIAVDTEIYATKIFCINEPLYFYKNNNISRSNSLKISNRLVFDDEIELYSFLVLQKAFYNDLNFQQMLKRKITIFLIFKLKEFCSYNLSFLKTKKGFASIHNSKLFHIFAKQYKNEVDAISFKNRILFQLFKYRLYLFLFLTIKIYQKH